MLIWKKKESLLNIIYTILQYLLVISIVLSNTIWIRSDSIPLSQGKLTALFMLASLLLSLINITNVKRMTGELPLTLVKKELFVIFLTVGSAIVLEKSMATFLLFYAMPLVLFVLYLGTEKKVDLFWKRFCNVVYILCLISLFFYCFASILRIIPATGTIKYKWTWDFQCSSWYNLYYDSYYGRTPMIPFLVRKNTGLYTEPPMFNIMVCMALAGELSFTNKIRKKYVIVFAITIITIMSTTGYLFLTLMMVILIFADDSGKNKTVLKLLLFPIICATVLLVGIEIISYKVGTAIGENSVNIRMDHLLTSIKLWIDNPVFGIGYGQDELFQQSSIYQQGASIGLPLLFALSGIWGASLYFIPFFHGAFISISKYHRYSFFVFGSFLLLLLTSVNYLPIMILVIASLIVSIEKKPLTLDWKTALNKASRRKRIRFVYKYKYKFKFR